MGCACTSRRIQKDIDKIDSDIQQLETETKVVNMRYKIAVDRLNAYKPAQYLIGKQKFDHLSQFIDDTDHRMTTLESRVCHIYHNMKQKLPVEFKQYSQKSISHDLNNCMMIFRDSPKEPEDLDPKQVSIVLSLEQDSNQDFRFDSINNQIRRNIIAGFDRIVETPDDCHSSPNIRDVKQQRLRQSSMRNIQPKNQN